MGQTVAVEIKEDERLNFFRFLRQVSEIVKMRFSRYASLPFQSPFANHNSAELCVTLR